MKNSISENIKIAAIFTFAFTIAVAFTASSLTFIVDNYGDNVEKTEVIYQPIA